MSIAINSVLVGIYNEDFPCAKLPHPLITWSHVVLQGHVNYFSGYITTTTRPMATKLDKSVT